MFIYVQGCLWKAFVSSYFHISTPSHLVGVILFLYTLILQTFSCHSRSLHSQLPCNHLIAITWASPPIPPPAAHSPISRSLYMLAPIHCLSAKLRFSLASWPALDITRVRLHLHSEEAGNPYYNTFGWIIILTLRDSICRVCCLYLSMSSLQIHPLKHQYCFCGY